MYIFFNTLTDRYLNHYICKYIYKIITRLIEYVERLFFFFFFLEFVTIREFSEIYFVLLPFIIYIFFNL